MSSSGKHTPYEEHCLAIKAELAKQLKQNFGDPIDPQSYAKILGEERLAIVEAENRSNIRKGLQVVCVGSNDLLQMGFPLEDDGAGYFCHHIQELDARNPVKVAVGGQSSAVIHQGTLSSWGDDASIGRPARQVPDESGDMITDAADAAEPKLVQKFITVDGVDLSADICDVVSYGNGNSFGVLTHAGQVFMYGCFRDSQSRSFCYPTPAGDFYGKMIGNRPVHVSKLSDIIKIAAGESMMAAVDTQGRLFTFGMGEMGELGRSQDMWGKDKDGKLSVGVETYTTADENSIDEKRVKEHYLTPKIPRWNVGARHKIVVNVACGGNHMLVVAREGLMSPENTRLKVFSTGLNARGQLGHGDEENRHELTLIRQLDHENIAYVSAGEAYSMALDVTNTKLYTFGSNENGELGRPAPGGKLFDSNPGLIKFGVPKEKLNDPSAVKFIKQIDAGNKHAFALTVPVGNPSEDPIVYTWGFSDGRNGYTVNGKTPFLQKPTPLPVGDEISAKMRVHQVAAGNIASSFLGEIVYDRQRTKPIDPPRDTKRAKTF